MEALSLCPFCGSAPVVQKWHGSGRHSTLVGCDNENCEAMPSVHGHFKQQAIDRWNHRPASREGSGS